MRTEKLSVNKMCFVVCAALFLFSVAMPFTIYLLTRQVLLEKLWDIDGNFVDEHALTSTISRVRNKIENSDHAYIKTVYGMGYMWIGGGNK